MNPAKDRQFNLALLGMRFKNIVAWQVEAKRELSALKCEWRAEPYYCHEMLATPGWKNCWSESANGFMQPSNDGECCDNCFKALNPRMHLREAGKAMSKLRAEVRRMLRKDSQNGH
jgi:hypothetical protein